MKAESIIKELRDRDKIDVAALSDDSSPCTVSDWLSTGCLVLDRILGGGLPLGRVSEIFGDPSTGKSLIASQVAATVQEDGGIVCYADTETAVSKAMMEQVGVNIDELIYASPDTVEEVFTLFEKIIEAKKKLSNDDSILLLIWDSIAATSAKFEMESDYGKATMGRHAALISQGLRKITRLISKEKAHLLLLNQTRQKIGVMYGDNVTTFGGKAVAFHSSVRVRLDEGKKIKVAKKKGYKIIGINTRAIIVKNKVAMPFQVATLPIFFGHGIDDPLATFNYLLDTESLVSSGSWYKIPELDEELRFQKSGWTKFYDEHYNEIVNIIMEEDASDETQEPETEE